MFSPIIVRKLEAVSDKCKNTIHLLFLQLGNELVKRFLGLLLANIQHELYIPAKSHQKIAQLHAIADRVWQIPNFAVVLTDCPD